MGGVTSFDVTVVDNLETCFQLRNGPFNTTKWHTQECIHRPHLLEPASTGLFVQQAKEKIKIGDGTSFLPVSTPGQHDLMNTTARLVMLLLLSESPGDLHNLASLTTAVRFPPLRPGFHHAPKQIWVHPFSKGLKDMLKFKHKLQTKCVFNNFCKQGLNL